MSFDGYSTGQMERRKRARRSVPYRMDVSDGAGVHVGYVVDITADGMRIRCLPGVEAWGIRCVTVHLPQWMALGRSVTVNGGFVWCRPFVGEVVEGGFVLDAPDAATRETILAVVDTIERAAIEDQRPSGR